MPPGRAGRLWLRHRLAVGRRGAELLDQKLRILRDEAERLTLLTEGTAAAWTAASDEAALWLVRAALLGGERAVRPGLDQAITQVELTWTSTIGVRHPGGATCTPGPDDVPDGPVADVHDGPPAGARRGGAARGRRDRPPLRARGGHGHPPTGPRDPGPLAAAAAERAGGRRAGPGGAGARGRRTAAVVAVHLGAGQAPPPG